MKYIQVTAANLNFSQDTKWILSESWVDGNNPTPLTRLCILECASEEEAITIKNTLEKQIKPNEDFYLTNSHHHVICSLDLLETHFNGELHDDNSDLMQETIYSVNQKTDSILKLVLKKNTFSQIEEEKEEEEDDYQDEFLGVKKWHGKFETPSIQKGYYCESLIYPGQNEYRILWHQTTTYQGKTMLMAYGCNTEKEAILLKNKILKDAREQGIRGSRKNLARDNQSVIISLTFLTKIYGQPTQIKLVNTAYKNGLVDLHAAQRIDHINSIYAQWNKRKIKKPSIKKTSFQAQSHRESSFYSESTLSPFLFGESPKTNPTNSPTSSNLDKSTKEESTNNHFLFGKKSSG